MDRAAIVTGGSSGIGLEVARVLAAEGFRLTIVARRPDKLAAAVEALRGDGLEVEGAPANVANEDDIAAAVALHRARYGRLDLLVNAAGRGIGEPIGELTTSRLDLQIAVNLRATVLFYRECLDLLRAAGAEHGNALVVNMSSIAGKRGAPVVSVYSAVKAGLIAWTESMNRELGPLGIASTALCPALVDTEFTDWIKDLMPAEAMIRPSDVAEAVRFLVRTSPRCVVPEIVFVAPGDVMPEAGP